MQTLAIIVSESIVRPVPRCEPQLNASDEICTICGEQNFVSHGRTSNLRDRLAMTLV